MPDVSRADGLYLPGEDRVVPWTELKLFFEEVEKKYYATDFGRCMDAVLAQVLAEQHAGVEVKK
ncbi:MAG: hypothetical protein AAB908_00425 [Patescibacteria group bacterium]